MCKFLDREIRLEDKNVISVLQKQVASFSRELGLGGPREE